ncbi:MAG TPA: transcriptional regulator [Bacteroidetes bacterium]|nr:transcriptional regulator [Bacteroidota bacterium]
MRFYVYLVQLDPALGSEIRKSRPCVVVSPNEMNTQLRTVIIAPLTSTLKSWPTRVKVEFQGKHGEVALDQIRTVDSGRLIKHLGAMSTKEAEQIRGVLVEMFM